jgi:hypothetical protein
MSNERIDAIKSRLAANYNVSMPLQPGQALASFCYARDDVRILLNHITALETRNQQLTEALNAILIETHDLTVQSRASAALPGARIATLAFKALGEETP